MAAPFALMELRYGDESSFCENATSVTSNTYASRIPCQSITWTPVGERIRDPSYRSRMNEEQLSNFGVREGTLEFTTYWPGHSTPPTGAQTETWAQDLLSDGLGGGYTTNNGTTVSAATTGASVTFTSTSNWLAGLIGRIGDKTDSRGNGQAFVVNAVASPVTFLTALPATPNNGDVIYACQNAYHDESVSATLTTKRFLLAHTTSGFQLHLLGCQLAGLKFSTPVGGLPTVTWSYRVAFWDRGSMSTPSAIAQSDAFVAPIAGGSVFLQDFATSTRATVTPSEIDLSLEIGLEPIVGPGGSHALQHIVGWQRTMVKPILTLTLPAATAYETRFDLVNTSYTYQHILVTLNPTAGRSVGFYMSRAFMIGARPSQVMDSNRQQYVKVTWLGTESTTTSTELTRSAIRFFMG